MATHRRCLFRAYPSRCSPSLLLRPNGPRPRYRNLAAGLNRSRDRASRRRQLNHTVAARVRCGQELAVGGNSPLEARVRTSRGRTTGIPKSTNWRRTFSRLQPASQPAAALVDHCHAPRERSVRASRRLPGPPVQPGSRSRSLKPLALQASQRRDQASPPASRLRRWPKRQWPGRQKEAYLKLRCPRGDVRFARLESAYRRYRNKRVKVNSRPNLSTATSRLLGRLIRQASIDVRRWAARSVRFLVHHFPGFRSFARRDPAVEQIFRGEAATCVSLYRRNPGSPLSRISAPIATHDDC